MTKRQHQNHLVRVMGMAATIFGGLMAFDWLLGVSETDTMMAVMIMRDANIHTHIRLS